MKRQRSDPVVVAVLKRRREVSAWYFCDHTRILRLTNTLRHCPVTASQSLIDLSLDPVATKHPGLFPRSSPAVAWELLLVPDDVRSFFPQQLTVNPANALMGPYAATGAYSAHSTTCSCPLNSILDSPEFRSQIRAVCVRRQTTLVQCQTCDPPPAQPSPDRSRQTPTIDRRLKVLHSAPNHRDPTES
jgi:hypothetical protein